MHEDLRSAVRAVCDRFPDAYWRDLDARREYPEAFVAAMTEAGFLGALIPAEYGGMGLDIAQTSVILEEINASGGNAQPAHAQVYTMGTLLRHGSEAQKREYLPKIASGELRLQAFGVTEPEAGTDTTSLRTTAHTARRPLRDQRPQDVHLARPALRRDDPARAHRRAAPAQVRRPVRLPDRPARRDRPRPDRQPAPGDDQQRHQRARLRGPGDPRERAAGGGGRRASATSSTG